MSRMESRGLEITGAVGFAPAVYRDDRGLFSSPYQENGFVDALGHGLFAVRDVSHNRSASGVLRGVHYTATPPGRAKYVYCPNGRVLDILVDLRLGSPTFGRHVVDELSGENCRAVYVPPGVGHAFLSMSDDTVIVYLMSSGYVPADELAVSALDQILDLPVPQAPAPARSDRDRAAPTLAQARDAGLLPDYRTCRVAEEELWN